MVPVGCALFPQNCAIESEALRKMDPAAFREMEERFAADPEKMPKTLYFNKGL